MVDISLPHEVANKIADIIDGQDLRQASSNLSDTYKANKTTPNSLASLKAYIAARMPATYAVVRTVFDLIPFAPKNFLDLGAGPGTASIAAQKIWGEIDCTLIEQHEQFIKIGKEFLPQSNWQHAQVEAAEFGTYELVVLSYFINELSLTSLRKVVQMSWEAADRALVIIQPGTPAGYSKLIQARDHIIELGGNIFAPCPHNLVCPLNVDDWCHFSVRVPRLKLHMVTKQAHLPYEDEKYSYFIATKDSEKQSNARIIKKPMARSGHVILDLCTEIGINRKIVSQKEKSLYKIVKKLDWGDGFNQ